MVPHDFDEEWRAHPTAPPPAHWVTQAWARHLHPGRVLIDLGCGTGRHSLTWARAGGVTYALDRSHAAIQAVIASTGELAIEAQLVDLEQAAALPPADVVLADRLLYLLAHPLRLVDLAIDALSPEGVVLIGDTTRTIDAVCDHLSKRAQLERLSASHLRASPIKASRCDG